MDGRTVKTLKEIVGDIRAFRGKLPAKDKKNDKINPDDPLAIVRLTSSFMLRVLEHLLHSYERNEQPATLETLKPFMDFITSYSYLIRKSDASYFLNAETIANKVVDHMAKLIGEYLNLNYYDLLMPGITGLDPTKKLHQYILRDQIEKTADGRELQHALLVEEGFAMLEKKYLPAVDADDPAASMIMSQPKDTTCNLNQDEENLLATHSEEAKKYYAALKFKTGDIEKTKADFLQAIHGDNYKVTATYLRNNERLVNGIISHIATKEQFLMLFRLLPYNKWPEFIKKISDEDLYRFMLGVHNYKSLKGSRSAADCADILRKKLVDIVTVNRVDLYSYEDKYVRALKYAHCEIYERTRQLMGKNYSSVVGEKVGSYVPSFLARNKFFKFVAAPAVDKTVKTDACTILKNHLLNKTIKLSEFNAEDDAFQGGLLKYIVDDMLRICRDPKKMAQDLFDERVKEARAAGLRI